jgi:poly(A) polymerase
MKVHRSALCIIPPCHTWPAIQAIRKHNDKSFERWAPHINLLYPFLPDSEFATAAHLATSALAPLQPFTLDLTRFSHFEHRRSCTLWLQPQPDSHLQRLHAALLAAFPDCTELSNDPQRGISEFTPHLSVGQWPRLEAVLEAAEHHGKEWSPLTFTVDNVALISRRGTEAFVVRWVVPLGGSRLPEEVNAPYVASDWV